MKRLTLVAVAALAACTNSTPTAPVGREFNIAVGETTAISGTDLTVTFVRVAEDSRCPMGAQCIQAGNAKVELRATLNGSPVTLSLNTMTEPKTGTVTPYRITLTGLTPYPTVENPNPIDPKDYRAALLVGFFPTNDGAQ